MYYLTSAIDADIEGLVVASCTVDDLRLVPIVEPVTFGHTVQLARVRSLRVRHPAIDKN